MRRAERTVVHIGVGLIDPLVYAYINRASDALFICACLEEQVNGTGLEVWNPQHGE